MALNFILPLKKIGNYFEQLATIIGYFLTLEEIFLSCNAPRPTARSSQSYIQWVQTASSKRLYQPGRGAEH